MVAIRFTYFARRLPDGRHKVNLYIKNMEPTEEETVYCERKSIADAAQLVREIVYNNCDTNDVKGQDRMLCAGDPPDDAIPVFMFIVGVNWNRKAKTAHYSRVGYQRFEMDGKWNPIASLGMEQYDYTMRILKRLEKKVLAKKC